MSALSYTEYNTWLQKINACVDSKELATLAKSFGQQFGSSQFNAHYRVTIEGFLNRLITIELKSGGK